MPSSVQDMLDRYAQAAQAAGGAQMGAGLDADPIKTAADAGAREAEMLAKTAASLGSLMGQAMYESFVAQMGYDAETAKTASFSDILTDSVLKVAADIQGNSQQAIVSADNVTNLQLDEDAAHHAEMSVACATDAATSVAQGDLHTAHQNIEAAAGHLKSAQECATRSQNPAVHNMVGEAAQAVQAAVSHVASVTG